MNRIEGIAERSQLLDIDFQQPVEPIAAFIVPEPEQARNIQSHNQGLDDVQKGAAPRVEAEVTSAKALLPAAGLDFKVESFPLFAQLGDGSLVQVKDRKANVRTDNHAVLGDVGQGFALVQNEQLAELADTIRGVDGEWTWGQGGALRGGSRVFLQLRGPVRSVAGEKLQSNISLFNAFDGSLKLSAGFSNIVIVCQNTFLAAKADSKNGIFLRHTSGLNARLATAVEVLKAAHEYTEALDNSILKLAATRFSDAQLEGLVAKLVEGDSGKAEKAREAIVKAYRSAPGNAPGTAWGAFQAVTNYTTHDIGVRTTSGRTVAEARVESSWWGTGAELNQNAWDILTDEAEVKQLQYVRVVRS